MSKARKVGFSQVEASTENGNQKPEFGQRRGVLCTSIITAVGLGILTLFGCRSNGRDSSISSGQEPAPAGTASQAEAPQCKSIEDTNYIRSYFLKPATILSLDVYPTGGAILEISDPLNKCIIPEIIGKLSDPDPVVQLKATSLLGDSGDARAVEPLKGMLHSENPEIRAAAARSLGKLGDARAGPALLERLSDDDYYVRIRAAHAFGDLGDPANVPALAEHLRSCPPARYRVVMGAVETDQDNWNRHLFRIALTRAIGISGGKFALPYLLEALRDEDPGVVSEAAHAIGPIGDESAVLPLIESFSRTSESTAIGGALIDIGIVAKPHLLEALSHPKPEVRRGAASVLGTIGGIDCIERLFEVARSDPDEIVRIVAQEAAWSISQRPPQNQ